MTLASFSPFGSYKRFLLSRDFAFKSDMASPAWMMRSRMRCRARRRPRQKSPVSRGRHPLSSFWSPHFSIWVLAWGAEGVIGARSRFDRYRVVGRTTSDDRAGRDDGSCGGNHFTYGLSQNWADPSRTSSRLLASRTQRDRTRSRWRTNQKRSIASTFPKRTGSVVVMVGWQSGFTDTRIQPDRDVSVTRPYSDTKQAPMSSVDLESVVGVGLVGIRSRRTSFGRMSSSNAFDVAAGPPASEDDPRGTPRQFWLVGESGRGDVRDKFGTDPAVRTAIIRCSRARSTDFGVANT